MELKEAHILIVPSALLTRGDVILYGNKPAVIIEINPIGKKCFAEILIDNESIFIPKFSHFYKITDKEIIEGKIHV